MRNFQDGQILYATDLNGLQAEIANKVQKDGDKVLSTEDYTKEDKAKLNSIKITDAVSATSTDLVTSSGISKALENKQDTLVSGNNIKTINNQSLLGEGNIELKTIIEDHLDANSTNSVQNKVITNALANKQNIQAQWQMTWSNADQAIRITFI